MSSEQPSGRHQELLLKHLLERISRQMMRVDREVEQLRASLTKLAHVSPFIADALDSVANADPDELLEDGGVCVDSLESTRQPGGSSSASSTGGTGLAGRRQDSADHDTESTADSRVNEESSAAEADSSSEAPDLPKPRPAVLRPATVQVADVADDAEVASDEAALDSQSLAHLPPPAQQPAEVSGDILESQPQWATDVAEQTEKTAEVASQAAANAAAAAAGAAAAVASLSSDTGTQQSDERRELTAASDSPVVADAEVVADSSDELTLTVASHEDFDDEFELVGAEDNAGSLKTNDDASSGEKPKAAAVEEEAPKQPKRQLIFGAAKPPLPSSSTLEATGSSTRRGSVEPAAADEHSDAGGLLSDTGRDSGVESGDSGIAADGEVSAGRDGTEDSPEDKKAVCAGHGSELESDTEPVVPKQPRQPQRPQGNAGPIDRLAGEVQTQDHSTPDAMDEERSTCDADAQAQRVDGVEGADESPVDAGAMSRGGHESPMVDADTGAESVEVAPSVHGTSSESIDANDTSGASDTSLPVAVHQRQVPSVRSVFDPEPDVSQNLAQITAKGGALPRRRERRRQENEAAARKAEAGPQIAKVVAPARAEQTGDDAEAIADESVLQVPQPRTEVFNAGPRHWTHAALHGWTQAGRQGLLSVPEGVDLKGLCLLAMCDAADEGRAVTIVVQTHREAIAWEHFLRHDAASAIPATRSLPGEIELCAIGSSAVPECADTENGRFWIGVGLDRWTGDLKAITHLLGQGAWVLGLVDQGESDESRLQAIGLTKPAYRLSRDEALDLRLFGSYRIALVPVPLYRTEANRYQATTSKVADATRALSHLAGSSDPVTLFRAARAWSAEATTGRQSTAARAWLQAKQQQMESLADVGSKLASVTPVLAALTEPAPATVLTRWSASSVKVATDLRKSGRQAVVSREKDRSESADAWRSFVAGEADAFVSADVPHGHLVLPKARTLLVTSGPVSTQQAVRRLSGLAQGGTLAIMFAPGTVEDPAEDPYGCMAPLMNNATALRQVQPSGSRKG